MEISGMGTGKKRLNPHGRLSYFSSCRSEGRELLLRRNKIAGMDITFICFIWFRANYVFLSSGGHSNYLPT